MYNVYMRTNIDIDDRLLKRAMKLTGTRTKRAAVQEALRRVVRAKETEQAFEKLIGVGWDADLDQLRSNRF